MAIALNTSSNYTPGQNHHYLNAWPTVMMENIWHFNQCAGVGAPVQTANDKAAQVYLQKEREYIARHLESAAGRMAQDLNYWINPAYFSEQIPIGKGWPVQAQIYQTRYAKLISLGKRATSLIQAGVSVTYSDPNSTGVADLATVTVTTAVTDGEIRLYFRTADGAPTAGDYRYEIEPITVTSSGGVATITAHRANFVKPTEWAREYIANDPNFNSPNLIDTKSANNFVTAVDVYRVYTDTAAAVSLVAANGTVLQTFTGEIIDLELGAFRLGSLCDTACWDYAPQRVQVNYYAGSPLVNGNIDNELYEAAAAYAAGSMQSKLGKMCYWTLDQWTQWHDPMVEKIGGAVVPIATKRQSSSGYGARTGQALAWEVVMDRRIEKAHKFF